MRFIGQVSHDLRNHLNAVELQVAYLAELRQDPEAKAEIKRLREMTFEMGRTLEKLTAAVGQNQPQMMRYQAAEFRGGSAGKTRNGPPRGTRVSRVECKLRDENVADRSAAPATGDSSSFSRMPSSMGVAKGDLVSNARSKGRPLDVHAARTQNELQILDGKLGA